ncbi:MAG: glycine zipper 2TM domain-containing protein [Burkholderiaceae bacterium]
MKTTITAHRSVTTAALIGLALSLGACSGMSAREVSTATGAAVGGVAGAAVTGTPLGTAAGAAAGAVVGNELGKKK